MRNYGQLFPRFSAESDDREIESITTDEILSFLNRHTQRTKQSTKRYRYSLLCTFFNFIRNSIDPNYQNPCDNPILKKLFKNPKPNQWKILEKDMVDEIIFITVNPRNRLMLELMARGGMRIGEVLGIRPKDIEDRKIILKDPKSGKELEVVFITQKLADKFKEYIREKKLEPDKRILLVKVERGHGEGLRMQKTTNMKKCVVKDLELLPYSP